jgi:hypothetical protein
MIVPPVETQSLAHTRSQRLEASQTQDPYQVTGISERHNISGRGTVSAPIAIIVSDCSSLGVRLVTYRAYNCGRGRHCDALVLPGAMVEDISDIFPSSNKGDDNRTIRHNGCRSRREHGHLQA